MALFQISPYRSWTKTEFPTNVNHNHNFSWIGHVDNIPTIKFCYGFSLKTQSKSHTLSLTERVCEFRNIALSDTV